MSYRSKLLIKKFLSKTIGKLIKPKGNRILMYHSLGTRVKNDIYEIYSLDINLFKIHLEYLHNNCNDRLSSLKDFTLVPNSICITFDDGFKDVFYKASPILSDLSIPFTVFVPPKMIIEKNNDYLSIPELRELSQIKNCTIGAHGYSHEPLASLSIREIREEISKSKNCLEDILGEEIDLMSYPHGSLNDIVKKTVKECGFKSASSSQPGTNSTNIDMYELKRTSILSHDYLKDFCSKINGEWDWTKWI